ncbi:MAG: isoaspartyl peptidase/L-asparaginase, partial [Chlamydiales bacterium]|nr:isoaspartyl peptidase/L-asparaginase [Chlamydiales bacterium]
MNPGEKLPFSVALGDFGLVLHGGAGAPAKLSEKDYARYTHTMNAALSAGWKALRDEASSLTAVLDAVKILEDSPLFNAGGLGVVLDNEGHARTDAGIMRGDTLKAGGVAHVRGVANPSQLARLVMDKSAALLLCGDGAEKFAIA